MGAIAGHFDSNIRSDSGSASQAVRLQCGRISAYEVPNAQIYELPAATDSRNVLTEIVCAAGGAVIAWEGRLDNRSDLIRRLGMPGTLSDAALVAGIYEADGESSFADIVGDWSLAVWDPKLQWLILASDYAGVRPLYYRHSSGHVVWSSCLRHVAESSGWPDVDENYLAEFALYGASATLTPYCGILSVPAGTTVRVSAAGLSIRRFWRLDPGRVIRYRDDLQYEQHCKKLLSDAVAARLRTSGPVYSELSGGLDSSSIVSIAQNLISSGQVQAPRLISVTYRHAGSRDEAFCRAVEQKCAIKSLQLDTQDYPYISIEPRGYVPQGWETRHRALARRLKSDGSTVLFTGQLGDLVMGNWLDDSEQVADLLLERRFRQAWSDALRWGEVLQKPVYSILGSALMLAFPWYSWNGAAGRLRAGNSRGVEDSVRPAFRQRAGLAPEVEQAGDSSRWPPARRKHIHALGEILRLRLLQTPEGLREVFYTHPYAHRPLVEFMLSIPARLVCGPGEPRRLMRRALRGSVAPQVLERRSKGSFNAVFRESLLPLASELLRATNRIELVQRGILDAGSLQRRLHRFICGLECNEPQLRQIVLLEFWLRRGKALNSAAA